MPRNRARIVRLSAALAPLLLLGAVEPPPDRCAELIALSTLGVTIENAERIPTRVEASDGRAASVCRVRGIARPTRASHIIFELWLPEHGWNGRYYQLGNGGFAGNIHTPSLAAEAARGNAAASTDTGHSGDGFDARWAAGNPVAVADYGYRSIKATSDAAAALVQAFYGRPAQRRYFAGCSNGGRQALMAAQRYPEDWDGIIAGAPANQWTSQLTAFATLQHRLRVTTGGWLPTAKLPAIQRAALSSCPAESILDGVALEPERCRFDPAILLCRGPETDTCLTMAQVESVRLIQERGFQPTAAVSEEGWQSWLVNPDPTAPSQLTFALQAFRHLLGSDPHWAIANFDATRDRASARISEMLDSDAVDYRPFRSRGGRIISYFGWADSLISPGVGLDYYRRVARRNGVARTQGFYRLFMVPGMAHCQGGNGPTAFGQSLPAPALYPDRSHDIRAALEQWVERGIAPNSLIAHDTQSRATQLLFPVDR